MTIDFPTRANLFKRGIGGGVEDTSCVWCAEVSETQDHLFVKRGFASAIWYEIFNLFVVDSDCASR